MILPRPVEGAKIWWADLYSESSLALRFRQRMKRRTFCLSVIGAVMPTIVETLADDAL